MDAQTLSNSIVANAAANVSAEQQRQIQAANMAAAISTLNNMAQVRRFELTLFEQLSPMSYQKRDPRILGIRTSSKLDQNKTGPHSGDKRLISMESNLPIVSSNNYTLRGDKT
jgi:hypothetical protein